MRAGRGSNGHAAGVRLRGPIRPRRSKLDRQTAGRRSIETAGKYHERGRASCHVDSPGSSKTNTAAHAAAPCIFLVVALLLRRQRQMRAVQPTGVRPSVRGGEEPGAGIA